MEENKPPVRFPPLSGDEMSEAQRRIATAIMAGRKSLSGPFNGMLRSPVVADPLQRIGAYIRFEAPAKQRLKEFAIIMTARFWSSEFEWHIHRGIAEEAGLDPRKADALLRGEKPQGMDDEEEEVYRFVAQLLTTGHVTDESFDGMKARFGEQQIADFIALVGYYCAASFYLNVDRHPLPDGVAPMPPLSGRPFLNL